MEIIPLDRDVPETWTLGPAVRALTKGQIIVIPTDTIYALACDPWDAKAVGALYTAKGMHKSKRCAVICQDQKAIGAVSRAVGDSAFRFMRTHLPGPFTVLLHAAFDLPRRATGKRKTLGVRIPDNPVCLALTGEFGRPMLVTSLPGWENGDPVDPVLTAERLFLRPAVVLDQGLQVAEPSTVVDFTVDPPELVRQGKGEVEVTL
jgi:tRNA threonylcarbamoyl adenosine modification protein (Sua5/YciO/YrdC/YwlC family)